MSAGCVYFMVDGYFIRSSFTDRDYFFCDTCIQRQQKFKIKNIYSMIWW